MIRNRHIFIVFVVISAANGWEYYHNLGAGLDESRDVAQCSDGGFFITGRSNSYAAHGPALNWYDYEAFLIKLNANGEEEWIRHYGQLGWFITGGDTLGYYDAAWACEATPDSGCIVAGKSQSPLWTDPFSGYPSSCIGNDNMFLVRVNKYGDTVWTKGYGGYYFDRAWHIERIPGRDEYYITGQTYTYGPDAGTGTHGNIWVMKIDGNGEILAQTAWGIPTSVNPANNSDARWLCITPEGGCAIGGLTADHETTYVDSASDSTITRRICKAVILKYDSDLNLIWEKIYDRGYFHYTRGITPVYGGGYLVQTYDGYPNTVTWILRLNEDGDTLWTKYISVGSTGAAEANYFNVVQAPDSGFYFAGGGGGDAWILKTDKNCNEEWRAIYNYSYRSEVFWACIVTNDGGCIGAGHAYTSTGSYPDVIYVARVDKYGNDFSTITEKQVSIPHEPLIKAYPNPFNRSVKISCNGLDLNSCKIDIFDLNGNFVARLAAGENIWTPSDEVGSGIYLVKVRLGEKCYEERVLYIR